MEMPVSISIALFISEEEKILKFNPPFFKLQER